MESVWLSVIHISPTPSIQRARWGEVEVILTLHSHFLTQPYVSASFVLAKSWQVAEKLFPFTLTEFSKAAVRAQASSWAKGRGAWKGHLEGGSPGKRNCCGFQSTLHSTEAGWGVGEILYWGGKRSQNTVFGFSTASPCLLNNEMKISLKHPVIHRESDVSVSYRQLSTVSKWNYPSYFPAWEIQDACEAQSMKTEARPRDLNALKTRYTSVITIYGFLKNWQMKLQG